jgi:hypothetical protein
LSTITTLCPQDAGKFRLGSYIYSYVETIVFDDGRCSLHAWGSLSPARKHLNGNTGLKRKSQSQNMEPADHKADMTPNVEETKRVFEAERTPTPEEERAVVRKIDMVVLPLMCFVFFLQYLDKQSLSYAAVG